MKSAPATYAVAVPVFDPTGGPIAALEVQVPDLSADTLGHVTPALIVPPEA